MTSSGEKRKGSVIEKNHSGKSKKKHLEKEPEVDEVLENFDEAEVEEVLATQEFPTKKISKKKIKAAEKAEAANNEESADTDSAPPAITYLLQWKNKEEEGWKFKKLRQTWLLQNMYNKEKVSKSNFQILLKYMEDLKGASRDQTLQEARKIVEENEDQEECADERKLKRALKILKLLT